MIAQTLRTRATDEGPIYRSFVTDESSSCDKPVIALLRNSGNLERRPLDFNLITKPVQICNAYSLLCPSHMGTSTGLANM